MARKGPPSAEDNVEGEGAAAETKPVVKKRNFGVLLWLRREAVGVVTGENIVNTREVLSELDVTQPEHDSTDHAKRWLFENIEAGAIDEGKFKLVRDVAAVSIGAETKKVLAITEG